MKPNLHYPVCRFALLILLASVLLSCSGKKETASVILLGKEWQIKSSLKTEKGGEELSAAGVEELDRTLRVGGVAGRGCLAPVGALLLGRLGRHMPGRPELAVRVRIAAAHDLAFVLKQLDIGDVIPRPELLALGRPYVDDIPDLGQGQLGQGQVMPGREVLPGA